MIDEVVMLRHGRTSFNLARRLQGQIDVPLDIIGQWQVDQSALELMRRYYWAKVSGAAHNPAAATLGSDGVGYADIEECRKAPAAQRRMIVLSSDLIRARQTAHAFADPLGLPVRLDSRLRERSFGQWEGMTREEIREMDAEAYGSWRRHEGGELAYGVESRKAVGERGAQAMRGIVSDPAYAAEPSTLMIVGHGSWIAATIETLIGMDVNGLDNLGSIRNGFWSRLSVVHELNGKPLDRPIWQLESFNEAPAVARLTDWENGPAELRNPDMPLWRSIAL